jgi:tetratricopeptide (TPR) repeat protein
MMVACLSCFAGPCSAQAGKGASLNTGVATTSTPLAIQLSPEGQGDLFMARYEYRQALDAYARAPKMTAEVWNKMGVAYHHLFAMEQAKHDYEQALTLEPNLAEALSNLGSIYFNEKDYGRAEKYYRKALKIEPKSAVIYHNLGMLYFVRGKMEKGVEALRKALALDPEALEHDALRSISEPTTRQERARENYCFAELFAEQGQFDQALEYLRKAIDEGFDDRKRLADDPAFTRLRGTKEYAQLVAPERPH